VISASGGRRSAATDELPAEPIIERRRFKAIAVSITPDAIEGFDPPHLGEIPVDRLEFLRSRLMWLSIAFIDNMCSP